MFFYMSKRIKSMTPSSLSPHYAAQSPSGRKPDLVAKEVLEWWQTNGKHPFIQPHISSPSNVGANSPENLPLGDKVQLIRLPVASPSAVKEFSQVSSEEPAHLTTDESIKIIPQKDQAISIRCFGCILESLTDVQTFINRIFYLSESILTQSKVHTSSIMCILSISSGHFINNFKFLNVSSLVTLLKIRRSYLYINHKS
ncbi:hypothetical protein F4703DRAFT_1916158 [Phycomyces blakesleeanus]